MYSINFLLFTTLTSTTFLNAKQTADFSCFHQFLGKGSFGVVIRGFWRGQDVAVKIFHKDSEQEAFKVRISTLIGSIV